MMIASGGQDTDCRLSTPSSTVKAPKFKRTFGILDARPVHPAKPVRIDVIAHLEDRRSKLQVSVAPTR